MIWVTWFTLILLGPTAPVVDTLTLSERYWDWDACQARIPAMVHVVDALVDGGTAQIMDGAACVPDDPSTPE